MKNNKIIGLTVLAASVLAIAACGGNKVSSVSPSSSEASSVKPSSTNISYREDILPTFNVVIKDAAGNQVSSSKVKLREGIAKPANPEAPTGQKFYGWRNVKNGGQIWDFEEEHLLNQVMADVELVPMFVPAGQEAQIFEAELTPEITEANGGQGLEGATYSGGAKGKQFIGRDFDNSMGATCVSKISYYEIYKNQAAVANEDIFDYACLFEDTPAGMIAVQKDVDINYGAYVHFNYQKGNILTWKLVSDKAVSNVTLMASFSAEYGKPTVIKAEGLSEGDEGFFDEYQDTIDAFNDQEFKVKVNGVTMNYGDVQICNIEGTSGAKFIWCQDYVMSTTLDLKEGENIIEMIVDNDNTLNGTIAASAPIIDSIKVYSESNITWPTAKDTNLIRD